MNGYSKMRANTPNSKSMDFSNLNFSPSKTQQDQCNNKPQDEDFEGERFGVILSRNCSSASQRFRENSSNNEKSNGTIGAVVRRAFSMRKSSSLVGDGYWRIHGDGDQVMIEEEEEDQEKKATSMKKKKKRGRIFRACKRFFKHF